jgi:predicted peroxiredoxin
MKQHRFDKDFQQIQEAVFDIYESGNVNAFMKDVAKSASMRNPINPSELIMFNKVGVELITRGNKVYLQHIRAFEKGKGAGKQAMELLMQLADKHGVEITLCAKSTDRGGMSTSQLKKWYTKYGFVSDKRNDGDYSDEEFFNDDDDYFCGMIRKPKKLNENTLLRQMMSIPDNIKYMALDKNGTKVVTPMDLSSKKSLSKVSEYWLNAKEIINNQGDHVNKVYFYEVDANTLYAVHTQDENPDLEECSGICFKPEKSAKGAPYEV